MNQPADENAAVQMLESGISSEKASDQQKKKKFLIIGGVVGFIVFVSIILGVFLARGSSSSTDTDDLDGTKDFTESPMIGIYASQPDFSLYKKGGKDVVFLDGFWKSTVYGGSFSDPIKINEGGVEEREIPNGVSAELTQLFSNKGSINGVFNLRNLYQDNTFYNIDIFAHYITSAKGYNILKQAHDSPDSLKELESVIPHLTGYVRVIKFIPFATKDGNPDPSQVDENQIEEVFEGYYIEGGVSKKPKYGRWFKNGDTCQIGFFSYQQDKLSPRFLGKGMSVKSDGQLVNGSQGIYSVEVTIPQTQESITDFRENKLPTPN